jgi:hypothetical protein
MIFTAEHRIPPSSLLRELEVAVVSKKTSPNWLSDKVLSLEE